MMLNSAIDKYVEYRRSLGESFKTNANLLKQFCNYLGKDMNLLEITASITSDFFAIRRQRDYSKVVYASRCSVWLLPVVHVTRVCIKNTLDYG